MPTFRPAGSLGAIALTVTALAGLSLAGPALAGPGVARPALAGAGFAGACIMRTASKYPNSPDERPGTNETVLIMKQRPLFGK